MVTSGASELPVAVDPDGAAVVAAPAAVVSELLLLSLPQAAATRASAAAAATPLLMVPNLLTCVLPLVGAVDLSVVGQVRR